jgi:F-type H+-transporting ATPase subunit epsilon
MATTFMLEIVTPDKNFYSGEVNMTVVRTTSGDIGILKDHEWMVAPLGIGVIKVKFGKTMRVAACTSGFVSVEEDKVIIITDAAEWSDEIDVERAKEAAERATQRIESKKSGVDFDRAHISMTRAMNRVRVADIKEARKY